MFLVTFILCHLFIFLSFHFFDALLANFVRADFFRWRHNFRLDGLSYLRSIDWPDTIVLFIGANELPLSFDLHLFAAFTLVIVQCVILVFLLDLTLEAGVWWWRVQGWALTSVRWESVAFFVDIESWRIT